MVTRTSIAQRRLVTQRLVGSTFTRVKDLVGFMCAMQAQDLGMAKWAVGKRLRDASQLTVDAALNGGDIIRTHVLRPTWHLVSSADIGWMLPLTAPNIAASMKARHHGLGLAPAVVKNCNRLIERALYKSGAMTREEIAARLEKAGIPTRDDNRLAHILLCAELDGLVCSGPLKDNKHTYALLEERVRTRKSWSKEEALAELARRYFVSHGPATLKDFVWWSGLPVGDARLGLDLARQTLGSESVGPVRYWFTDNGVPKIKTNGTACLLPAYDEFLIAYRDRSAMITSPREKRVISSNGIFRPTIVVNGVVSGVWTRKVEKAGIVIEIKCFTKPELVVGELIKREVEAFAGFLGSGAWRMSLQTRSAAPRTM